jgi:hypothetical protein
MNKAMAASIITENIGGWPRDIQAYLTLHGLPCEPYTAHYETDTRDYSEVIGFQFADGSIIHEDFEDVWTDEDGAEAWFATYKQEQLDEAAWEHRYMSPYA